MKLLGADNLDPALEAPDPISIIIGSIPILVFLLLLVIILLIKQLRKKGK